ncbi:MAG: response regulator transcription factor [Acetobacteraceae bacterium]
MRAFVVNFDSSMDNTVSQLLRIAGFVVECSDQPDEAAAIARRYKFDVIVLDTTSPASQGLDVLRDLRRQRVDTPVMVVCAGPSADPRIRAFSLGADDVVSVPFNGNEFIARVTALIRRSKGLCEPRIAIGNLVLHLGPREATFNGRSVGLTAREYAVLEVLALRKGIAVSKDTILDHLYGGMDEPDVKIVDVFICKIRRKLAEAGAGNPVATAWGRGYLVRDDAEPVLDVANRSDVRELLVA